jgi:hypothetical protein
MANQDPEIEAFSKFVEAIEPWLDEVVLIGGWAHLLFERVYWRRASRIMDIH